MELAKRFWMQLLTDANVGLEDHADIVRSVADGQRDRVLLGGFD